MPAIEPGQKVIRLISSTTGRQIYPNLLGVIGGLQPGLHANEPSTWTYYFPVQWMNGLWSNMEPDAEGYSWKFYP